MARTGKYAQPPGAAWRAKRAQAKAKASQARLGATEEPAGATADDSVLEGYEEFTKDELAAELKARELPHTGTKEELISRLYGDDEFGSQG